MSRLSFLSRYVRRPHLARRAAFESLEHRNMPAVLVDVGYHGVEPDASGQVVTLSVTSDASDTAVAGFDLRAQIVTAKQGPYFEGVRFAGNLWNSFPHVESGSPYPADRTLASGSVAFTQGFEARAEGALVKLTIDTTGIPAGSYEFRLIGTRVGSSSFRRADGSSVTEVITNGTLHVRSIWQNRDNPDDVDGDGHVTPRDVLLLLNELSKAGSRELPMPSPGEQVNLYDVNGDGYISPLDALRLIRCLNEEACDTAPQPILAQVTPDFLPDPPGSTSVETPNPESPSDPLPGESDPDGVDECASYETDEDGNPIPISDPGLCKDSIPLVPATPSDESENLKPETDAVDEATSSGTGPVVVAANAPLSSGSVDAVIEDVAKEISGESSEDLVDLGLAGLFAQV